MKSELGEGSTFSFSVTLPIHNEAAKAAPVPRNLRGASVLVVDDNQTNRLILDEMLKNWEMQPELATGGVMGVECLKKAEAESQAFQLVLLDLMMPDMDGLAFGRLTYEAFAVFGKCHDRRRCTRTLGIGNNNGFPAFHDGHAGIRCS